MGSCFGEISLLLNEPNKYSYAFNARENENLFMLSIDSLIFLKLCEQENIATDTLTQRAFNKDQQFESYRKLTLLTLMRSLNCENDYYSDKYMKYFKIMDLLLLQYDLTR